jgi:DNA-binding protein|tara:strand:+ start:177 stop:542 length:366 start_codon:yes stop_codon:yes gene_type:complete
MNNSPLKSSRDFVVVGLKPIMNYVVACMTLFNAGKEHVKLRARGRHITKAVDAINMLQSVFLKDLEVDKIEIGTDKHIGEEGKERFVSTIEIRITQPSYASVYLREQHTQIEALEGDQSDD